jgi:hypothetical protein
MVSASDQIIIHFYVTPLRQLAERRHPTYVDGIADLRIPTLRRNKDMR